MENEVSVSLQVTLTVFIIAMVLSTVLFLVGMGQEYMSSAQTSASEMLNSGVSTELEAVLTHGEDIPVASVYLLLERDMEQILTVSGIGPYSTVTNTKDLTKYLSHTVHVSGSRTSRGFNIIISP